MRAPFFGAVVAGAFALSCSGSGGDTADSTASPSVFIAFAPDFQPFHTWQSFHHEQGLVNEGLHTNGPRTEYLNHPIPAGATEFPIGTIIAKEIEVGAPTAREIFAMVKRGAGFNSDGASGWEWFALNTAADGTVTIRWRGVGPPAGETYGGDSSGGCNSCHMTGRTNDFVLSQSIRLPGQ